MEMIGTKPAAAAAPAVRAEAPPPAVTVVVPCYNGGQFLDGLMASLARQTFRDFEIVIVDDGSKDTETLRKLAALEDQVRVIREDNRGPSAARNVGIAQARTDIVFTLDCDDTVEPAYLAETVALLRAAPPDVAAVITDLRMVGMGGRIARRYFNRFDLLFTNTLSVGMVMRKRCWLAVGGYDESMREGYEDWEFSLRLADAGYRALEVPRPLYCYRSGLDQAWPSRSSQVDTQLLHAALWRAIRRKHAGNYHLPAMLRIWWQSRDGSGRISLFKGLAACALAGVLPDRWFSHLVVGLRTRSQASARSGMRLRLTKDGLNGAV